MKANQIFITAVVLLSAFCFTLPAFAQSFTVFSIVSAENPTYLKSEKAFADELTRLGYGPDKVKILRQRPNPDIISWVNSARRAEAVGASALATFGAPATRMALKATSSTPLVFSSSFSPLAQQLTKLPDLTNADVQQSAGISANVPLATLMQTFSEVVPKAKVSALFLKGDPERNYYIEVLNKAAEVYGFTIVPITLDPRSFGTSLKNIPADSDALFLPVGIFNESQLSRVFKKAEQSEVPILGCGCDYADRSAMINIAVNAEEQGRVAAENLVSILEGKSPSTLRTVSPREVDLVMNLQVARRLGLTIPFEALAAASKIIR